MQGAGKERVTSPRGELMSAESSLTAVAVVRALLNQDTEGLAVLLPDGLPGPGRLPTSEVRHIGRLRFGTEKRAYR